MTPKMKDPARAGGANRASRCSVLRTACPSIIAPTGRGQQRYAELLGRHAPARGIWGPPPSRARASPRLRSAYRLRAAKFRVRRVPLQSRAEVAVTKRIQTNGCASWWTEVPLKDTEKQRRLAALRSKEPLSRVTSVWLEIHRSAQDPKEGGKFEFDGGLFAFDERVEQETIDAIVKVFELPGVALIVDGRSATFIPPEPSRDAKYNKTRRHRTNLAGAVATAEDQSPAAAAPHLEEEATSQNGALTSSGDLFTSSLPTELSELVERLDSRSPLVSRRSLSPAAARDDDDGGGGCFDNSRVCPRQSQGRGDRRR